MSLAINAKLIVKHTFLEVVPCPTPNDHRRSVSCPVGRRNTVSNSELDLPVYPGSSECRSCEDSSSDVSTRTPLSVASTSCTADSARRNSRFYSWADEIDAVAESDDDRVAEKTTVMLRNVPYNCSRNSVVHMMEDAGFSGLFDFIYLPIDFRSKSGFGYAFINMVSNDAALKLFNHFNGFSDWAMKSQKVAEVTWSEPSQGLDVHVGRYRNSPVMHDAVPDEFKPAMYKNGVRVPFPAPSKAIRAPRFRRR